MTHKQWLDNEYSQWIKALQESTVHNFKEHPMVKRMLGEIDQFKFCNENVLLAIKLHTDVLYEIDQIGFENEMYWGFKGVSERMVYYATELLKQNPSAIVEIGGGVGQFYAILRAIGYQGEYDIIDLPEVREFQIKYLQEVNRITGLNTELKLSHSPNWVVSFYALGEFDKETKEGYKELLQNVSRGYIAYNPHSGASGDLSIFNSNIKVTLGIEPGIKIIKW